MGELAFMPKMVSATYYCHTVDQDERGCNYPWTLTRPSTGRKTYNIVCPRCGHSFTLRVSAPRQRKVAE